MKPSSPTPHLLLIAAPMLALAVFSQAQTPTTTVVSQTTSAVTLPQDLHAAGTLSSFDAKGLTVLDPITGSMTVYLTNSDTMFVDTHDRLVPPERITQQTPVKVYYTPVGNMIVATKVVVNTALNVDGTLVEVSPGVLVIEIPGAATTSSRYINNTATRFVDQNGKPVPPESVKAGEPVRVFYTKEGDALVASRVEMLGATGQPKTTIKTETTKTTTLSREIRR